MFAKIVLYNLIEKVSPRNRISILVLKDIVCKFGYIYILIGFLSAITLALQIIGIAIILSSFNGNLHLPFHLEDNLMFRSFNKQGLIIVSFFILSLSAVFMFLARKLIVY
jgi:hypothetical protein